MKHINMLKLELKINGEKQSIYPVLLQDQQEVILIDCGYPNFLSLIESELEKNGISLERLSKIIITHHDFDHMGSLADFKRKYPRISIISSSDEAPYISGKRKSLRLQQAEWIYNSIPEEQKEHAIRFQQLLESIEPVEVDIEVKDHDYFPWCSGIEIISTPGHMPGHISIYCKEYKTLISGDALVIENNELTIANPQYTLDIEEAKKSIMKLLTYDIEKIICYHGGLFTGDIKYALKKIIS